MLQNALIPGVYCVQQHFLHVDMSRGTKAKKEVYRTRGSVLTLTFPPHLSQSPASLTCTPTSMPPPSDKRVIAPPRSLPPSQDMGKGTSSKQSKEGENAQLGLKDFQPAKSGLEERSQEALGNNAPPEQELPVSACLASSFL